MAERKYSDSEMYEQITAWLKDYYSATDKYKKAKAKALIVTKMLPVIKRIAHTIARRSYDPVDDLVQAGAIGLLKAIDNYSFEINDCFKIYSGYRIIGEMKHYLRDKSRMVRVPRYVYELTFRINTFIDTLTVEELNELTNEDVAEALELPTKAVDLVLQYDRRNNNTISLENLYSEKNDRNMTYEEVLAGNDYKEASEIEDFKIVFRDAISQLPREYRELVELFYYNDLTRTQIGEIYNLTPMQISRKFKKAFSMLYRMIADKSDAFGKDAIEAIGRGEIK